MSWIGIFIVLLVLFFVPFEITIFFAILATAIYFWQITLIILPILFVIWLIFMILEGLFDSIANSKSTLKNRLFHLFDLDNIVKDEDIKSIEHEKKMLRYSEKRKKIAEDIMKSWKY